MARVPDGRSVALRWSASVSDAKLAAFMPAFEPRILAQEIPERMSVN